DPAGCPRLLEGRAMVRRAGVNRRALWRAALAAAGALVGVAFLWPYAVMLLTALKPEAELRTAPPRLLPQDWRPGNFAAVIADPGFRSWLSVSLIVSLASTALAVAAAVPAAYYTARHVFRG